MGIPGIYTGGFDETVSIAGGDSWVGIQLKALADTLGIL